MKAVFPRSVSSAPKRKDSSLEAFFQHEAVLLLTATGDLCKQLRCTGRQIEPSQIDSGRDCMAHCRRVRPAIYQQFDLGEMARAALGLKEH